MLHSLNARSSTNQPSRTPGLPNGRVTNLRGISETTPPQAQTTSASSSTRVSPSDAPPVHPSVSSSTSTIKRSSSPPIGRPGLSRSTSAMSQTAALPGSPDSGSVSSEGGDFSLDMGSFENGIAARKHYRLLDSKLDLLREAYRKDPRHQGLSDYDLNQGAKSIELENPEERLLYKELRDYVVRDGKLGPNWEKYCATRDASEALDGVDEEVDEDDLDDPLNPLGLEEEDSGGITGKYHDALDEPHVEAIDLGSFEEPERARSKGQLSSLSLLLR